MDVQKPGAADSADSDLARWRSAVAGVLAKSTRRDPADLPAEPERLLDSPTYEGFPIRPLYTGWTRCPSRRCPGGGPMCGAVTRCATSSPAGRSPRRSRQTEPRRPMPMATFSSLLTEGVSALVLRVGGPEGVAAGRAGPAARRCVRRPRAVGGRSRCRLCRRHRGAAASADRSRRGSALAAVAGPRRRPVDRTAERAAGAERGRRRGDRAEISGYGGGVRAITVDGPAFHDLGASASWELAGSVAAAVAYLRLLGEGGLAVPDALRQISFRYAADDDQFMTIAKLRAARQLWARVAEVVGEPDAGAARVHAVTSLPMMAAARSVGEHAAHHAGRVLRRRRWCRFRAGASV